MSERRWGNFSSCCRLCLSEKLGTLKSIFEDAAAFGKDVVLNIQECVGVEIKHSDKLSTMICEKCTAQVNAWRRFRDTCFENQSKLVGWMNDWTSSGSEELNVSIRIKDEVLDESDTNPHENSIDDESNVHIKSEPIEAIYHVETEMADDTFDYPPPLTPEQLVETSYDQVEIEMDGSIQIMNGSVSELPENARVSADGKKCLSCNKAFTTVANRQRHDAVFHRGVKRKYHSKGAKAKLSKTPKIIPESPRMTLYENNINGEAELQKIQFAAGLQLQQRTENSIPIALEDMSLTKIEQSYLDKCKTIISMTDSLTCVCHKEKFDQVKDLYIHLKKQRQWFAMFTCYNCLITYTERSAYMKHFCGCSKDLLHNLRRLTESPINPDIKMRLYQNYKCIRCNCIFGFYEDFCSHFDVEHMELLQNSPPYKCLCAETFEEMEDYKQHLHISCFLRYFCDVCFEVFTTVDEFRIHCENEHDNSEPGTLLPFDPLCKPKNGPNVVPTSRRSLPEATAKRDEDNRLLTRRRTINMPSSENSSQVSEATPDLDEEDPDYLPDAPKLNSTTTPTLKSSNPTACPDCGKMYSTYHNMLRHYKLSHDETGRILECRFCNDRFRLITELKEHESNVHAEDDSSADSPYNFSCPDCGDTFQDMETCTRHMETHPKKACDECDKEFCTQRELDQHRSVHLNIKVYRDSETKDYKSAMVSPSLMCETCDKTFSTKSELRHHKLLHEKMPVLSVQEGSLIEEKIDLSKKFSCIPCDKHYVSYGGIWDHNRKHHPNKQVAAEYPKKCSLCFKVLTSRGAWVNHEKMHERLANMKQDIDDTGPLQRTSKYRPIKTDDDDESYHTCKRCFKVFSSKSNLRNHMKCHGININAGSRSSTKTGKIIKTYWCNICHQACPGYAELQEHKREHLSEKKTNVNNDEEEEVEDRKPLPFECNECSLRFSTTFGLARHQEKHTKKHESSQQLVSVYCKYCKVPFPSVSDLNDHMDRDHSDMASKPKVQAPGIKHVCKLCKKVFDNAGALSSHQGWHKRVKFNRVRAQEQLLKSMAKKSAKSPSPATSETFPCPTCSMEFPTDPSLQIHILEVHRNINATLLLMKCNSCKMSFEKKSAYDIHMQLHKQVESKTPKAFPCKYCPAGFSKSDALTLHMKQQHKEFIEYRCHQCNRLFDKQNALTVHLKMHERQRLAGETASPKPIHNKNIYFCSICDLGFVIAKDLRNHVVTAHPF
ncbi:hypothetical protein FQR65_LT03441 [Abscondita terminalis]|nr:hypothetical protein FQR65_LT03441 [Abscondita terminalis]